jgi:hypothetical protein
MYLLVIITTLVSAAPGGGASTTTTTVQFNDINACEKARTVLNAIEFNNVLPHGSATVHSACIQKN